MLNSRDIDDLRADVAANCRVWMQLCRDAGLAVCITGTVRDRAYQEYCYRNGTSKGRVPTFHAQGVGLAFDFCKNVKGQEYSDPVFFQRAGELGERVGFEWGGRWKSFPDRPHLQWSGGGKYTGSMILAGRYPPAMPLYRAAETAGEAKEEGEDMKLYHWFSDMPDWARGSAEKAYRRGILQADADSGAVNVYECSLQTIVWLDRLGLLEAEPSQALLS